MNQWTFPTKIYAGEDSLQRLTEFNNESILIICDPFLKDSPNLTYVMSLMDSRNKVTIYTDVVPDPPITHVVKGIEFMEGIKPTVIIAIGGGSCIDMSKGIAYFGRKLKHMDIKSFIAVPTTSGTGSEVTAFAVLTDSETQIKYPLVDDAVLPDEALLTPLFVKTSPPNVTAFSLVHAMAHQLGGQFHVPHGLANSMLLPYVIGFNCSHNPAVAEKYARLSAKLGFAAHNSSEADKLAALIEAIVTLEHTLDCPMNLTAFGVDRSTSESKLDLMADRALEDMCYRFNPYPANHDDIVSLYKKVL